MRFPSLPRAGLGVGLDLPWDGRSGFGYEPQRGDALAYSLREFLRARAVEWSHAFFSWQPRDRALPRLDDYTPAWDDLASVLPPHLPLALHHTALNLGSVGSYRRGDLLAFTNQLCERYGLLWVNEDVGLWSLAGRPVPYPLPPVLTDEGLRATIANVAECQAQLAVPLLIEFPGFSRGVSLAVGDWHAYDFFRVLAQETESPVTLDTGHLLSWQWWRGLRGTALLDELERLPLTHCFEVHLSGCEIVDERFVDAHHGHLLDAQVVLLERILELCPNLRAVTFEDPRFEASGRLQPDSDASFRRLEAVLRGWSPHADAAPTDAPPHRQHLPSLTADGVSNASAFEDRLASLIYDCRAHRDNESVAVDELRRALDPIELEESARAVRDMVRGREYRGTGGLEEWFPKTLAAWRRTFPDDEHLDLLLVEFCGSPACAEWNEAPGTESGISLEEAWYRFFIDREIGDKFVREEEFLSAILRALAVTPRAAFCRPSGVKVAPGGHFALTNRLMLHTALDGTYGRGPVTPLVGALLESSAAGSECADASVRGSSKEVAVVLRELRSMRLIG